MRYSPGVRLAWADPSRLVAGLVVAGYAGIAFAVHNFYPFSVFDMYSRRSESASRIAARDEHGELAEVGRFEWWECGGTVDASPSRCGEPGSFDYVPYLDDESVQYIARHAPPGDSGGKARPVDVVRRIWWLTQPGPPRIEDCVLARCRAVRR